MLCSRVIGHSLLHHPVRKAAPNLQRLPVVLSMTEQAAFL